MAQFKGGKDVVKFDMRMPGKVEDVYKIAGQEYPISSFSTGCHSTKYLGAASARKKAAKF